MSGETPEWVHKSEARRGWTWIISVIVGSVALFSFADCRLKRSEALKNEFEAQLTKIQTQVQEQTAPLDLRIRQLEAERGPYETRKAAAEAEIAETESEKVLKPVLMVTPAVELTRPYKDVSQIQCKLQFENVGKVDVALRRVEIEVHHAIVTEKMREEIDRTQRIADRLDVLDRPVGSEEERAQREAEIQELRKKCPHGQLFAVSPASEDVTWERVERLCESRDMDATLRPDQSVFDQFNYVLTESLRLHYSWFRLVIVAYLDDGSSQRLGFVIPTRDLSPYRPGYTVCTPMTEEVGPTVYQWHPGVPLAPIKQDNGSQE